MAFGFTYRELFYLAATIVVICTVVDSKAIADAKAVKGMERCWWDKTGECCANDIADCQYYKRRGTLHRSNSLYSFFYGSWIYANHGSILRCLCRQFQASCSITTESTTTTSRTTTTKTTSTSTTTSSTTSSLPTSTTTTTTTTSPTTTSTTTSSTTSSPTTSTTTTTTTTTPTTTSTTTTSTTTNCNMTDIVFLVDESGSVTNSNFNKNLEFLSNITMDYPIGPSGVQVSVVTFDDDVTSQFDLNDYGDNQSLQTAIKNIAFGNGGTDIEAGLMHVADNSFLPSAGARTGVPQYVVLMTDGQGNTGNAFQLLHDAGINVISFGIGSGFNINQLETIASDPSYVITVDSYDNLYTVQETLQNAIGICQ